MDKTAMRVNLRLPQEDPLTEILQKVPAGERSRALRKYALAGVFMEQAIQDAVEQLKAYIRQENAALKTELKAELLDEIRQMGLSVSTVNDSDNRGKNKTDADDEFVRAFTKSVFKAFDVQKKEA